MLVVLDKKILGGNLKYMKIGMQDNNCKADISVKFDELCTKIGRLIAPHMETFLPARVLFRSALDRPVCSIYRRRGEDFGACGGTVVDIWSARHFFFHPKWQILCLIDAG